MKALEKRVAPRRKMVLPLRSSATGNPTNSNLAVHTLDLSRQGAKLGAFRQHMRVGDVFTVHRQHKRAQCRVVWVREMNPGEIHVGIEFLATGQDFWGIPLGDESAVVYTFSSRS